MHAHRAPTLECHATPISYGPGVVKGGSAVEASSAPFASLSELVFSNGTVGVGISFRTVHRPPQRSHKARR